MSDADTGLEIKKKVTEAVTRRVTQETAPTKAVKPRPTMSEERIRQIITEEIANIKIPASIDVPEFNQLLEWCENHISDPDCHSFLEMAAPVAMYVRLFPEFEVKNKSKRGRGRGGGGWIGPAKATLTVLRKMQKERRTND